MGGRAMLSAHLRRVVVMAVLAGLNIPQAFANVQQTLQQAKASERAIEKSQRDYLKVGKPVHGKKPVNMQYVPQYMRPLYSNLNPKQLTAAQRQGLHDVQHILKSTPLVPKETNAIMQEQWAQALGKRGMGIADASLAASRQKVLQFLGFKPQDADRLFYFVSFSMPKGMLRAYAEQALWDGGILVFKGPLPHVPLATFITKYLNGLAGMKGASATITIDPRLYDVFRITEVPTLVYSMVPENRVCRQVHLKKFQYDSRTWTYPVCNPVDPKDYWKIEGAVTSEWALRQFKKAGAPGVSVYLRALAKGPAAAKAGSKTQQPYTGSWATAPSPAQLQAIAKTVASFGEQAYQTPFGVAVGPEMQIKANQGIHAIPVPKSAVPSASSGSTATANGVRTFVKHGVTYRVPG